MRSFALLLAAGTIAFAACGPTAAGDDDNGDGGSNGCTNGQTRCDGQNLQVCSNDQYVTQEQCANA